MTTCASKLLRPLLLGLLIAHLLQSGCRYRGDAAPTAYTQVSAVSVGTDASEVFGIAIRDGVIYVSDGADGVIRRVAYNGSLDILASGLHTPSAIAFLPRGELIVADTGSHTIRKISEDGAVSILAGIENTSGSNDGPASSATFNAPVGVAVDADASIYIADTYNDRIRVIRDGVVSTIAGEKRGFADGVGASVGFDTPLGLSIWGNKLLVADSGNARIRVVEKDGIVTTLAGGNERDLIDGSLASARFVNPTAITVDESGRIFVADGNAIRIIGRRVLPLVETLAGDRRGYRNCEPRMSRFSRPSGLAIGSNAELYIADSDNRVLRVISNGPNRLAEMREALVEVDEQPFATRWPFDPPQNPREIAGTLGELRGEIPHENTPVWFHNGLDIAGAYGETAKFLRSETVLDPHATENFGTSRELLRMPLIGYIHLRLGRDKDDHTFGDPRFQFELDVAGKPVDLRIPRGTSFSTGDTIGTLNSMNHVHLIAGRIGEEINALAAIDLPGIADTIPPVIEDVSIFSADWTKLSRDGRIKLSERSRVVVRAYDRMNGNSERRRLGVYRIGYQLVSNGSPISEIDWTIKFDRMPSNDAVKFAYAEGSRSGYTADTIFDYIATNRVDGDSFSEGFLDASTLASGAYTLRVFAADYFGNVTSKDVVVVK